MHNNLLLHVQWCFYTRNNSFLHVKADQLKAQVLNTPQTNPECLCFGMRLHSCLTPTLSCNIIVCFAVGSVWLSAMYLILFQFTPTESMSLYEYVCVSMRRYRVWVVGRAFKGQMTWVITSFSSWPILASYMHLWDEYWSQQADLRKQLSY